MEPAARNTLIAILYYRKNHLKTLTGKPFLRYLANKIKPAIEMLMHDAVIVKRKSYRQQFQKDENDCLLASKQTFYVIKSRIIKAGLHTHSLIKKCICIIESIISFRKENDNATEIPDSNPKRYICNHCDAPQDEHRIYVFPSYAWGLFNEVAHLCQEVFNLGREDLISEYIEVRQSKEYKDLPDDLQSHICSSCDFVYSCADTHVQTFNQLSEDWVCPACSGNKEVFFPSVKNSSLQEVRRIEKIIFAPSVDGIIEHNCMLFFDKNMPEWALWNFIDRDEWIKSDPIRDKLRRGIKSTPKYKKVEHCLQRRSLLQMRTIKEQVSLLINNTSETSNVIYNEETINNALKILLSPLFTTIDFDMPVRPRSLKIVLTKDVPHDELYFDVWWDDDFVERLHVQTFRESSDTIGNDVEGKPFSLIERIYDNPGKFYSLGKKVNVRKILQKTALPGVLYDYFIENKSSDEVALRSRDIPLNDLLDEEILEILEALEKLDVAECSECKEYYCICC